MLAAAAPALSPALPVQAAARVLAEESASVSAVLSSGKFTTENGPEAGTILTSKTATCAQDGSKTAANGTILIPKTEKW